MIISKEKSEKIGMLVFEAFTKARRVQRGFSAATLEREGIVSHARVVYRIKKAA